MNKLRKPSRMLTAYTFILKCLFQVSPWYLPVHLFHEFMLYSYFMCGMLLTKHMINNIISKEAKLTHLILGYGIYYAAGFLKEISSHWIQYYFTTFQKNRIQKKMRCIIYEKTKEIDLFCYEDTNFYDKYNRAVYQIQDRIYETVDLIVQLFGAGLRVVSIVYLFAALDFVFVVAAMILCMQVVITLKYTEQFFYNLSLKETPVHRKTNYIDFIFKSYQFVKEFKIYHHYDFLIEKYRKAKKELKLLKTEGVKQLLKILFIGNLVTKAVQVAVNGYVILQIVEGKFTVGDFTLIYTSIWILGTTLSELVKFIPKVKINSLYMEQLLEILDYQPVIHRNEGGKVLEKETKRDIALNNLVFSYPNAPDIKVLKNISMEISHGEKIAIVGRNGSGKSTLVKVLLYLYQQNTGDITCNRIPYGDYQTASLRDSFGVVFQDFQIYSITIGENIIMREVKEEDEALIWSALMFCGLYEKVSSLEKGIFSVITKEYEEEGVYFSGGELQKLAIARAYVKNSPILIFDEPSSALDPVAEYEIFEKLKQLGRNKTVIHISHRLASTVSADCIYVLEEGEITERGNHYQLMKQKGIYYTMFMNQAEYYIY